MSDETISPQKAAEAAAKFYREATGIFQAMITLEEIELKEGYWYVTLGIEKSVLFGQKDYKIFKVDSVNGDVESMTMKK